MSELGLCEGVPEAPHEKMDNCINWKPLEHTEMTSLTQIKAKLDAIAESQGRLLAALDKHDEWAKDTNRVLTAEAWDVREQGRKEWQEAEAAREEGVKNLAELLTGLNSKLAELREYMRDWFASFDKRMTAGSKVMQGYLDREKQRKAKRGAK
jgi:hypothetical protein